MRRWEMERPHHGLRVSIPEEGSTTSMTRKNGQSFSALHAALALPCPARIIEAAMKLHGREMSCIRDIDDNLPLHYAVRNKRANRRVLTSLLRYFPRAASIPDDKGRLPLHEALKNGRKWDKGGVKHIFLAYPDAITEPDPEHAMIPVALAAISCDLTTIYSVLRECPQVICAHKGKCRIPIDTNCLRLVDLCTSMYCEIEPSRA